MTATKRAERESRRRCPAGCAACAPQHAERGSPSAAGAAAGPGSAAGRDRYAPGHRAARARHLARPARGHHLAAVLARARAHVDEPVGGAHRVLVVLDDDHRVAEVAQPLERARSACGCRAGAARSTARRGCSSTPTRLEPICVASRMRWASPPDSVRRRPVERQVADADVVEERQALADLAQDPLADHALGLGQRRASSRNASASRTEQRRELGRCRCRRRSPPATRGLQPGAVARRAGPRVM